MTGEARFNTEALALLRRAGGEKLLEKMTRMFIDAAPSRLLGVEAGLAAGAFSDAERAAHSLKGSAGQLGAMSLHDRCDRLEKAIAERNVAAANSELSNARKELEQAVSWLKTNTQTKPEAVDNG